MALGLKTLAFFFIVIVSSTEALRLLVFFPIGSKSHSILGHGVVDNLLKAGHEVVHVTAFPKEKSVANLTEINVSLVGEKLKDILMQSGHLTLKDLMTKKMDPKRVLFFIYEVHKQTLQEPAVVDLFTDVKQNFDGVIVEWFFSNFVAGIAPLFEAPLIWLGSTEAHWQLLDVIDEPSNPSFNVDLFSSNAPPLNFWQRLEELYKMIVRGIYTSVYVKPLEREVYDTILADLARKRGVTLPTYEEAVYNASFMFINSHPSIGTPYRLPQNAKYVAGYHIDREIKPLPKDLQKIMDESKHGVIYFSMGTNLRSADMSENMKASLLSMFGRLEETVIWKFETDLDDVPKNVHLVDWAPQQSIFAHPNFKFFIGHGGQLSTTEAIHYGIPVIGIPILGDQHINMNSVSRKGFGIKVNPSEDHLVEDLFEAIQKMKSDPTYKKKAQELSAIYHNRQQTPGEDIVYWTEYVIATKGAPHLKSPALTLPLYKKLYLDLLAYILIATYLSMKSVRKFVCKRCKKRAGKKEKTK